MGYDNVIEINGNRYDAITGGLVSKSRPQKPVDDSPKAGGRVIDGFIRPNQAVHSQTKPGGHGKPVKAHHPEHSKTLMRHAVHKPQTSIKPAIRTQAPAEIMAAPESTIVPKHSALQVDEARLTRAQQVHKHHNVQRFSAHAHSPQHFLLAEPAQLAVVPVQAPPPLQPLKAHHPRTTDMFERAIAHATSHTQPAHKVKRTRRSRLVNTAAIISVFLLIAGFITYLNLPAINLRMASMQAGFSASMPGYKPVGYAQNGSVKYETGKVTLGFRSGDSSFQITQRPSSWNSQTLLENSVSFTGKYQTLESKGRTIYVYNGHNATWVDGGIRYDITGNAHLSNGDITSIADSF